MAMTAFEIFGVLKLDTTEFNKGLDSAKSGVMGLVGGGLKTAAKAGLAAVSAASTAVVGFGKSSISAASSFESAFTGVRKTVDATEKEYSQLSDWIMEASTKMASSKEDIAATMEIAGQLGIRGVEGLEKFTETMIMLGDSTNLSSEEAASALAKFMNITGDSAENAAAMGSVIVDLGNHFATTEQDIVNMATRLASAGTIAGLTGPEIMALSTAMSSVGIQAEAGGTAMAQTLKQIASAVELSDVDEKAKKKLETLAQVTGMTAEQFKIAWGEDTIGTIQKFIVGLSNAEQNGHSAIVMLDELGMSGIRQSNMLQALSLASGVLGDAVSTANSAYAEGNALSDEATKRYGTMESQAMQTAEAFKNLKVVIGQQLLPMYGELMSFSSAAMQEMTEGFQKNGLTGLMESIGKAISEGLKRLVQATPKVTKAAIQLLKAFAKGIKENMNTILFAAGDIVEMLMKEMVDATKSGNNILLEVIESILGVFEENYMQFMDMGAQILLNLLNGISEHIGDIVYYCSEIINHFIEVLTEYAPDIIDASIAIITALVDGITNNLDKIIPAAVDLIIALTTALIDHIDELAACAIELVVGLSDGIIDARGELLKAGPELIGSLIKGIKDSLFKFDREKIGWKTISKFIDSIQTYLPNLIPSGMQFIINIIQGITEKFDLLGLTGEDTVTTFGKAIEGAAQNIFEYGQFLMNKLIEGIKDRHPILTGILSGITKDVENADKKASEETTTVDYSASKQTHVSTPAGLNGSGRSFGDNSTTESVEETKKKFSKQIDSDTDFSVRKNSAPNLSDVLSSNSKLKNAFIDSISTGTPSVEIAGGYGTINAKEEKSYDTGDVVTAITDSLMNMQLVVNIGNKPIEAMITSVTQRTNYRSGGR